MIKKILIVDDSPVARRMLRSCIPKDRGYEFLDAGNGKEAVDLYKEQSPDLTFMDLTMPVMDGFEAIEKIIEHDKDALIIVVSADVQVKSIERVMDLGAYMMLKKSIRKQVIQDAISRAEKSLQDTA